MNINMAVQNYSPPSSSSSSSPLSSSSYKSCDHTDAFLKSLVSSSQQLGQESTLMALGDAGTNLLDAAYERLASRLLTSKSNKPLNDQCTECLNEYRDAQALGKRLFMCVQCQHVACFFFSSLNFKNSFPPVSSHMHNHSVAQNHYFAIDLAFGSFYCFICNDFQYDSRIETRMRHYFDRLKLIRFGKSVQTIL